MKKIKYYFGAWLLAFACYNLLYFITQGSTFAQKNNELWLVYVILTFTFIAQLVCAVWAFKPENQIKLVLYKGITRWCYEALAKQMIGVVLVIILALPKWIGAAYCLVLLVATIIELRMAKPEKPDETA